MQAKIGIYFIDTPLRTGNAVVFLEEKDSAQEFAPMQYTLQHIVHIELPDDVELPWRQPLVGSLRGKKQ